jgi:chondroitin AC lyase
VNVIIVIMACILASAGTLGVSRPVKRPPADPVTPRSAASEADDMALLMRRLKAQVATPNYPNYGHDTRERNRPRVQEWLSTEAADGHWPDIDYKGPPIQSPSAYANPANPSYHSTAQLSRLVQMATAYASSANPDDHSPKMVEGIAHGLAYWYKNHTLSDNWWSNTIGDPTLLTRILVPLEDVLPADVFREGLTYYVCPMDVQPGYAIAQNLVSYAQQQVIRGILARSPEDIAAGSDAMQREIRINTGEGIQRDLSFHEHGPQLYDGGYGHDFIVDTSKYAALLAGTRFAFTHEKLSLLADHILEGSGCMIRGKLIDYSARGREIVRRNSGEGAVEIAPACEQLAALLPERAAELMALAKHIEGTGAPYSYLGNRYFWNSDFMIHQRAAYYISVKMISSRTVGTETIHGENMKGSWLPFGATWIVRRGDEYKNIFPVLDWGRLPGVTSPHMTTPPVRNVTQQEPFVGGVSDGTYGAAAMVFDQSEVQPLVPLFKAWTHGQKAWFFFDHEMVALGAGITSSRDEPVGTTLNQTLLHGPVLIDGHEAGEGEAKVSPTSWVLHDEVGYTFLGPTDASIKVGPQTGSWKSISASNPDTPVTESVFALWIDHGVRPRDAQYAYAVVPGVNAEQLAGWAAHPPVRVIANTTAHQAVINDTLGVAEIVFYRPGSVELSPGLTIKVDHACLALATKHGNSTHIAVSSPGGEVSLVHVTLTTRQKEQHLTFELPGGDLAGKPQAMDVPVRW